MFIWERDNDGNTVVTLTDKINSKKVTIDFEEKYYFGDYSYNIALEVSKKNIKTLGLSQLIVSLCLMGINV